MGQYLLVGLVLHSDQEILGVLLFPVVLGVLDLHVCLVILEAHYDPEVLSYTISQACTVVHATSCCIFIIN